MLFVVAPFPSQESRRLHPFDSTEFPTLLPHQITYNAVANNPPPPPYSREPLAGHYSVMKVEDLFTSTRRRNGPERPESRRERRRSESGELTEDLTNSRIVAGESAFFDSRFQHSPHVHWGSRNAIQPQSDIYHSTPIPSMSDLENVTTPLFAVDGSDMESRHSSLLRPSSPVVSTTPTRPSSSQNLPLASMPVIVGSQDLSSVEVGEPSRPSSRQSLRYSQSSFPTSNSFAASRHNGGEDIPPLILRQPSPPPILPYSFEQTNEEDPVSPQGPPPPLRSLSMCRTPPLRMYADDTVTSSPPIALDNEVSTAQTGRRLNSLHHINRSITFPRLPTRKSSVRLPPITRTNDRPHNSEGSRVNEAVLRDSSSSQTERGPEASSAVLNSTSSRLQRLSDSSTNVESKLTTIHDYNEEETADVLAVPLS